jgi:hypothetical protein
MNANGLDPKIAGEMQEKIELLNELVKVYGQGVLDVVDRFNQERIVKGWKALGQQQPAVNIDTFVNLLWKTYCVKDGLHFSIETADERTQIRCTYCPWVEVARAAGSTEIGYHLLCLSDPAMVAGFNLAAGENERPIRFTRTQTLMQGDESCDHTYSYG